MLCLRYAKTCVSSRWGGRMNSIKWLVLGYFLCLFTNGCDIGITSPGEDFEVSGSGLGSSPHNPIYVKIVE